MEKLTEQEKSDFTAGFRAASSQSERTYKKVALLRSLSADIPSGTRINGEDVDRLVSELEAKGVILPSGPVSDTEVRNLRGRVVDVMPKVSLRGIPVKVKAKGQAPATYDSSDSLKMKARMQEQQFNLMLAMEGDSQEKLEARLEEARDPLLKIANRNNPKRK